MKSWGPRITSRTRVCTMKCSAFVFMLFGIWLLFSVPLSTATVSENVTTDNSRTIFPLSGRDPVSDLEESRTARSGSIISPRVAQNSNTISENSLDTWDRKESMGLSGLLIPFRLKPLGDQTQKYLNVVIPKQLLLDNLMTGRQEVLTFHDGDFAEYLPETYASRWIQQLSLMSDLSYRMIDSLRNEYTFDQAGRLTKIVFATDFALPEIKFKYAEKLSDEIEEIPFKVKSHGDERVKFLNALIPRQMQVTDLRSQEDVMLEFEERSEHAGYFPLHEGQSTYERLALMSDGSVRLYDKSGNKVLFDTVGEAKYVSVGVENLLLYTISFGSRNVTFRYKLDGPGSLHIKKIALSEQNSIDHLDAQALSSGGDHIGNSYSTVVSFLNNFASICQDLGDYPDAKTLYGGALSLLERQAKIDPRILAILRNNKASLHHDLGDDRLAESLYSQAQRTWRNYVGRTHPFVAITMNNQAMLNYNRGHINEAEELYQRVLDSNARPFEPLQASVMTNLGALYDRLGQQAEAESLYQRSLKKSETHEGQLRPETSMRHWRINSHLVRSRVDRIGLGHFLLNIEKYEKAFHVFTVAVEEFQRTRQEQELLAAYIGLGNTLVKMKRTQEAEGVYQKAVDLGRLQSLYVTSSRRSHFWRKPLSGGFLPLQAYEGLVGVKQSLKNFSEAFFLSEHTRAQLLTNSLTQGGIVIDLPEDLSEQERRLIINLNGVLRKRTDLYEDGLAEVRRFDDEILTPSKKDFEDFLNSLRRHYPSYVALKYAEPLAINDLFLDPEEVVIVYEVTENATYAWLIQRKRVTKAITISVSRNILHKKVKQFRASFEGIKNYSDLRKFEPKVGKELFDLLFKEFVPFLEKGTRLVIVPDEILGILPFEALVEKHPEHPAYHSGQFGAFPIGLTFLEDLFPISYSQSATALSLLRMRAHYKIGDKILVLADPMFGAQDDNRSSTPTNPLLTVKPEQMQLMRAITEEWKGTSDGNIGLPRLVLTGQMADKMSTLFGEQVETLRGMGASELELRQRSLKDYKYQIYATHGILNGKISSIEEPALILTQVGANPRLAKQDGFLTMSEIPSLKMNADLVALTACDTGLGRYLTGEGVMGLGWAFQYAGAKSVLMSLWSVEDESTNLLTEQLFTYLKSGYGKLDSLRRARQDLRESGYAHPFFWAAFILAGEP